MLVVVVFMCAKSVDLLYDTAALLFWRDFHFLLFFSLFYVEQALHVVGWQA